MTLARAGTLGTARERAVEPTGGRFVPGSRLAWLLVAPIGVLLLAPFSPDLLWAVAGLDLALIALSVGDAAIAARQPLDVLRRLPHRLSIGAPNPAEIEVHNRGRRALFVRVWDQRPATFESDTDEVEIRVPAFGRASATTRVTPPSRGLYEYGDVFLRVRGPLGLGWSERVAPLAREVKVYPDVRASRALLAGGIRDLTVMGVHQLRREGEGSEFESLRDYVPGDPFRDINWKATARRERPIVVVREPERSQTLLLCIDAGRLMAVKSGPLTKLDHAVNAALLLAFLALRNDDRVGVLVFADEVKQYIPPGKGNSQYRRILEALYATQPSLTYVDYRAFARAVLARQKRRALILTFTEIHDEATSRPLVDQVARLARRHLPVIVALRDPALEASARKRPQSPEDPWRMAVAAEILEERESLCRGLTTAGARILDRLPEEALLAAVNAYVEIKRRHLL